MGRVGDGYDGVHIFAPDGNRIGQIRLPEICGNLCFGGTKRNRLFVIYRPLKEAACRSRHTGRSPEGSW
jgi:sugar lactone lactonase YvrE